VNHCPVPVESISADLNLDMISRNDPNSLFLVAVKNLSTELDKSLNAVNVKKPFRIKLDYTYGDKTHPEYYFSSDHYPFMRMGVPSVTLFCGKTPDYHQPTDTIERVDFAKVEKVARFAYAAALEIGNRPALLKLDVNPKVTARGKQNIEVESIR
jgi:Iap family predicted aminopeptidase